MKCMIINGPNLNMLKYRDKEIYGNETLDDLGLKINEFILKSDIKINVDIFQTNSEGEFINYIQKAIFENYDFLIVNPAAYSHYSIAIHDALEMYSGKSAEVHISKPSDREEFRQTFITAKAVDFMSEGEGINGYINAFSKLLNQEN